MLNCAVIMGRLTADPELRQTPNGTNVCSFSVAVNRAFAGANGESVLCEPVAVTATGENPFNAYMPPTYILPSEDFFPCCSIENLPIFLPSLL